MSYDIHSMYSTYAALCGCLSIVVPDENISLEQWQPKLEKRYGVAYGEAQIKHAEQTRPLLKAYLEQLKEEGVSDVRRFIQKTQTFFKD